MKERFKGFQEVGNRLGSDICFRLFVLKQTEHPKPKSKSRVSLLALWLWWCFGLGA